MTESNRKFYSEVVVGYFFSITSILVLLFFVFVSVNGRLSLFQNRYKTYYEYGNGIKKGTTVTLNGINIGQVTKVGMDSDNRVEVTICIPRKFSEKIRKDSIAKITRPLMIGTKQISITPGTKEFPILKPGEILRSQESSELIDMFSGIKIDEIVNKLDLKQNFFDLSGDSLISAGDIYEQAVSAIFTLGEFQKAMNNMSDTMAGLNQAIVEMSGSFDSINRLALKMDEMGAAIGKMAALEKPMESVGSSMENVSGSMLKVGNAMTQVTESFDSMSKTMGSFSVMMEDLKPGLEKGTVILSELDILLKAFQNSWVIKKEVDQVKKEMEAANQTQKNSSFR